MERRLLLALVVVPFVSGMPVSPARAEPSSSTVATVTAETPISAGGGWLLWSVRAHGGWDLQALHAGRIEALPVPPRPQPFDVSVGTDAHGAPAATFSRCKHTPSVRDVGIAEGLGGSLLDAATGVDCRIHVVELASGHESLLSIPAPAGASDTSPSMWHGSVAFARRAPGHGDVWQVMLWSPGHPRSLRTLRHGAIPTHCPSEPGGCAARPAHGEVESLDRDAGFVTFLWAVEGPGVVGEGAWEVRVDDLATGQGSLAEAGFGHEACTGPPAGLEYVWPEAPVSDGRVVLFPQLDGYSCFSRFGSALGGYQAGARHASSGGLDELVLGLAKDGNAIYGLVPPPAPPGVDSPSCSAAAPCTLERITQPPLTADRFSPAPPFVESQ
jgi:hypothetical protein